MQFPPCEACRKLRVWAVVVGWREAPLARRMAAGIPNALLAHLLSGTDPKTAFDANGLLDELKEAPSERS